MSDLPSAFKGLSTSDTVPYIQAKNVNINQTTIIHQSPTQHHERQSRSMEAENQGGRRRERRLSDNGNQEGDSRSSTRDQSLETSFQADGSRITRDNQEEDFRSDTNDGSPETHARMSAQVGEAQLKKECPATSSKKRESDADTASAQKQPGVDRKTLFMNKEKVMIFMRDNNFKDASGLAASEYDKPAEEAFWRINTLENKAWIQEYNKQTKEEIDKVLKAIQNKLKATASETQELAKLSLCGRKLVARTIIYYRIASLQYKLSHDFDGMKSCCQCMSDILKEKKLFKDEITMFKRFLIPIMENIPGEVSKVCKKVEEPAAVHVAFVRNSIARVLIRINEKNEAKNLLNTSKRDMMKAMGDAAKDTDEYKELIRLLDEAKN